MSGESIVSRPDTRIINAAGEVVGDDRYCGAYREHGFNAGKGCGKPPLHEGDHGDK